MFVSGDIFIFVVVGSVMMFAFFSAGWRFGGLVEGLIDKVRGLFIVVVDALETFPLVLILHECLFI
jgi:hypothetical protein